MTTTTDRRDRIRAALRAYVGDQPDPSIGVVSAARVDSPCRHCGDLVAVAIRRTCTTCPADHVARICSACATAAGWGDHAEALTLEDRALLRETAHRVGRLRGAA